ncbi:MAG: hypothetical protein HYR76_01775 [Ignavibacteria bacterium]|nr:hypothetical protein [Ignavibacteria bacterium]MBI3766773.1 hypothetical protein [Ignavibacteriales bacterium]
MKYMNFVWLVLLVSVCAGRSSAQLATGSATSQISVTPAGIGLTLSSVDCDVSDVIRGVTYNVIFDPAGGASIIHPADNGEATSDLGVDIVGDPSQNLVVLFELPASLSGSAGAIPISFGSTSGVRVEDGALFNPNIRNTFNSGTGGTVSLRLGFTFTVPASALSGDSYFGTILTTAAFTGT